MKRIVKFRVKSKRTGEWLYGDLVRNVEGAFAIVPPFEMTTDNLCDQYEVDENTIGQFTGITDKAGKEIYEGDIMQYTDPKTHKNHRFHVVFDSGRFGFRNDNVMKQTTTPLSGHIMTKWEVIGNMYDNPEMLKQD